MSPERLYRYAFNLSLVGMVLLLQSISKTPTYRTVLSVLILLACMGISSYKLKTIHKEGFKPCDKCGGTGEVRIYDRYI